MARQGANGRVLHRRALVAGGVAAFGSRALLAQNAPSVEVFRGPVTNALVSLTFDAGADRGYGESILDTLAAEGVKATFGMTGQWAVANSDLLQRMVAEGHTLINHTYSHPSFTGASTNSTPLPTSQRLAEIESTEEAIINVTGAGSRPYFRPPYGDYDAGVLTDLGNAGFTHTILWSLDVLGWNGLTQNQIVSRVTNNHGNGYIYLMHVGGDSQEGPALPRIIAELRNRGYGFATVPNLLQGIGAPPPPPGAFVAGDTVRVTARLNLRTAPNTSGRIVATMPVGTNCTVLAGPSPANGFAWYQLQTPYGTGWAAGQYLSKVTTPPPPPPTGDFVAGDRVKVTAGLYLRTAPSTSGRVLLTMPTGTVCTILAGPSPANGYTWYQVETPYGSGWAAGEFLVRTTTSPPPAPGGWSPGDRVRTTANLRLRSVPSTSGTIVATMPTGTVCTVLGGPQSANGYTWYRLQTPYGEGWAAQEYLARA